jgi:hypothetical protein
MKHAVSFFALALVMTTAASAHNSYTGGYSGAPGKSSCASSCHGGTSGTLTVTGFPATYSPGQTYTVTIAHSGGNPLVNVNATTRLGTTTTVAGTFTAGTNTAVFTGADGGIYFSTHLVDNATFQWKAPASGSGTVNFYSSGFQSTSTSNSSGQSKQVTATSTEITTAVGDQPVEQPREFTLSPNYPNPFNPETNIRFTLPEDGRAVLKVFNIRGQEVAELFNGIVPAGRQVTAVFKAANLPSGIYFSRLEFKGRRMVQKMILAK